MKLIEELRKLNEVSEDDLHLFDLEDATDIEHSEAQPDEDTLPTVKVRAYDIDWCVEDEDVEEGENPEDIKKELPEETTLDVYVDDVNDEDELENAVLNALSDEFGWLVNNCGFEIVDGAEVEIGDDVEDEEEVHEYPLDKEFEDNYKSEEEIEGEFLEEDLHGMWNNRYKEAMSEEEFKSIIALDPTFKANQNEQMGKFGKWLLKLVTDKSVTARDMIRNGHEYHDQLEFFNNLAKRNIIPANEKDFYAHKFRSLEELMTYLSSLGGGNGNSEEEGSEATPMSAENTSDFQIALRNIKQLFADLEWPGNIPDNAKSTDYVTLVGQNSEWEVWEIKNPEGAYLFDQWGNGAKWCVGGMGWKGTQGKSNAEHYYPYYINNGKNTYVCFQNKQKNKSRPDNKYLITMTNCNDSQGGVVGVSQFNTSDNYSAEFNDTTETVRAFAGFLMESGLINVIKNSRFKTCESVTYAENLERLQRGEPYIYTGAPIPRDFKKIIKKVTFSPEFNESRLPNYVFIDCSALEEVTLPTCISDFGRGCFLRCNPEVKILIDGSAHDTFNCYDSEQEFYQTHCFDLRDIESNSNAETK